MRLLWLGEVQALSANAPETDDPWYLTLPGAEGKDIEVLVEAGLVELTETQSIAETDVYKVVAVEKNTRAVAALQRRFAGLRIKEVDFRSLIRAEGHFSWPDGDDERLCRARIVNLDLDAPLAAVIGETGIMFPILAWIDKLFWIHSRPPALNWTLCLTLHAALPWAPEVCQYASDFMRDNAGREPAFRDQCAAFLGDALFSRVTSTPAPDYTTMDFTQQQRVLMILVPKLIALHVHGKGWRVSTPHNISYGGGGQAPMASWIIRFTIDPEAAAQPDATYRDALRGILANVKTINDDGSMT
jgi:hypothetical protein